MQARHYINVVVLALACLVVAVVYADDKKVALQPAPPSCQSERTEIALAQQDVNNYRAQVSRLATALESIRAERDALKTAAAKVAEPKVEPKKE